MAIHTSLLGVATCLLTILAQSQQVLADPSYACSEAFPKPVEWDAKPKDIRLFRVNHRNIRVSLPQSYKKNVPSPMIIAYHDRDMPPDRFEYETSFFEDEVNKNSIVVYPSGENVSCNY
jgi:hypothetical protein